MPITMPFNDPVTQSNSTMYSTHPPHHAWSLRGTYCKRHVTGTFTVQFGVWWAITRTHCFVKNYMLYSLVLADFFFFFNQIIKWKGVQFILINIFHRSASKIGRPTKDCALFSLPQWTESPLWLTECRQILPHLVTTALQRRPLFQAAFQGQAFRYYFWGISVSDSIAGRHEVFWKQAKDFILVRMQLVMLR